MTLLIKHHTEVFQRFPMEPLVPQERPAACAAKSWLRQCNSFSDDDASFYTLPSAQHHTDSASKTFFSTLFTEGRSEKCNSERYELLPDIESALFALPGYQTLSSGFLTNSTRDLSDEQIADVALHWRCGRSMDYWTSAYFCEKPSFESSTPTVPLLKPQADSLPVLEVDNGRISVSGVDPLPAVRVLIQEADTCGSPTDVEPDNNTFQTIPRTSISERHQHLLASDTCVVSNKNSEWRWSFHDDSRNRLSPDYSVVSQSCPPLNSLSASFKQPTTSQEVSLDKSKDIHRTNCQSPISGRSVSHFGVQQTKNPLHTNCVGWMKHADAAILPTMPVVTKSCPPSRSFPEALWLDFHSDRHHCILRRHSVPPSAKCCRTLVFRQPPSSRLVNVPSDICAPRIVQPMVTKLSDLAGGTFQRRRISCCIPNEFSESKPDQNLRAFSFTSLMELWTDLTKDSVTRTRYRHSSCCLQEFSTCTVHSTSKKSEPSNESIITKRPTSDVHDLPGTVPPFNLETSLPYDWKADISSKRSAPLEMTINHTQAPPWVISSAHSSIKSRESVDAGSPSFAHKSQNLSPHPLDQNGSASKARVSCLDCPSDTHCSQLLSFYELLTAVLDEQRRSCCRPESLSLMTTDQIQQEKIDLQKGLLYFERLYGRPKDPVSRRIMKPLYERYRLVKRLLRRLPRGLESTEYVRNAMELENPYTEASACPTNSTTQTMLNASTCASRIPLVSKPHLFRTWISPDDPRAVDGLILPVKQNHESFVGSNLPVSHASASNHSKSATSSVYTVRHSDPRPNSQSLQNTQTEVRPKFEWKRNHTDHNRYTFTPVQSERVWNVRSQLLARKRVLQRELREFENNVRITTGHSPRKADRKHMREKYLEYRWLNKQLEELHPCLQQQSSSGSDTHGERPSSPPL
ncbi:hypothetical protein PHET_05863 [Paragonimus heterotremus]|uniref:FAM13A-like domain-containing protein n=1 Tax=Paragonimus heterotremus TaxID=100268 RepID=A0A8J4SPD4_9TREM|nr:hypothetical protein PHET_05863 [Paragonimus heterotremus]